MEYSKPFSWLRITGKRFWEIDFLRGIAIILMIIFHAILDMSFFGSLSLDFSSGFWFIFPRFIASIFIVLMGISLTISYSRSSRNGKNLPKKYVFRGLKIFFLGLIITAATWLLIPQGTIWFGILHFAGISIILAFSFSRFGKWNLIPAILLGILWLIPFPEVLELIWLYPQSLLYMLDYFPLIPWLSLVFLGMFLGSLGYEDLVRKFRIKELGSVPLIKQLCWLGRHSLVVYFLHQPVLIAIIFMLAA